jgi:dihydromonapterin reductase/dihydrofolate reductase
MLSPLVKTPERTDPANLNNRDMNNPILITGASQRVGLELAIYRPEAGHLIVNASRHITDVLAPPTLPRSRPIYCKWKTVR